MATTPLPSAESFTFESTVVEPDEQQQDTHSAGNLVLAGDSVAARRLRSQVRRVAPFYRTALVRGEAGSGKQAVARAVHALSPAADGPFIVAEASAVAASFAGGDRAHAAASAALESARGGTLYLRGVDTLSPGLQAALLGFLRMQGERRPLPAQLRRARFSEVDTRGVEMRILAASSRDLHALAAIGQYRQDLCAGLSAVEIVVPALRERAEDIPMLAAQVLQEIDEPAKTIAEAAITELQGHAWPGNLRDLDAAIRMAAARAGNGRIEVRHLAAQVERECAVPVEATARHSDRLEEMVRRHVLDVLERCGGNKLRAAELLGISRSTLYRMLDAMPVRQ